MDTLYFDVLRLGYHFGLAILVGGGLVVGAAAAPGIFRAVPAHAEAATIFSSVLGRFDSLALPALLLVVLTSVLRVGAFGEELADARVLVRWAALAAVFVATLYGGVYANPVAREIRRQTPGFDDLPPGDGRRREFAALHERSRRALAAVVLFGVVAIYLS